MRPCLLREAHLTWMCSGFWPHPQGPAQCGGPHSFGIRSPRLTFPEILIHPSAKRGQSPLLKACSWTNLQRHPPNLAPMPNRSKEEAGRPQRSWFHFPMWSQEHQTFASPSPRITGSQAHPTSCHFLCTCLPALPSSAGSKGLLDLCPAFTEANWLLLPWSELKPTSLWGEGAECRESASISPLSPNV